MEPKIINHSDKNNSDVVTISNTEQVQSVGGEKSGQNLPKIISNSSIQTPTSETDVLAKNSVPEKRPLLDNLSIKNYNEMLEDFKKLFTEVCSISEIHTKEYVDKAVAIEAALNAMVQYNQKALEQLRKLTVDAITATENSKGMNGELIHIRRYGYIKL